jgi:NAD(P)-dependent dehydrogenase (short-subunit alcohol dehydrogenase family)
MNSVQGKAAFVTGASSGIGEAAAIALAEAGADVALLATNEQALSKVADRIRGLGRKAVPVVADVSKPEELKRAIDEAAGQLGRLDIVFANAGVNGKWAPIEELTVDDWEHTININLRGTFLTIKYAVPHMTRGDGGSIIVTASVNGTRMFSNTGATIYSTSKAGQVAMTKMLALELARYKIRVNVICPGWISTNIEASTQRIDIEHLHLPVKYPQGTVPLTGGKPGSPEQVAKLVVFLASEDADHISGTEMWIDGAESLLET